jgi:glycosyltransferase involved in cell wall biosynthesis
MTRKHQFYAWTKFQRRAVSMQDYFGYDLRFIQTSIRNKYLKPADYIVKGLITVFLLLKHRPNIVWIQLPPAPLLNIALTYRKIFGRSILIVDCHNGMFWGKWKKYLNKDRLNSSDIVVVHNGAIRDIAASSGINPDKLIVLEDKPAQKKLDGAVSRKNTERPQVLMPCNFNVDEPLETVFDAARQIPDVNILISGQKERGASLFDYSKKPDNVTFTGYLSLKDYETVFRQSDLALGLTTENHIQLSVANEAAGFEIPMVISDTRLLRELFDKGAVYVETFSADSIAAGIREALTKINVLRDEVKVLNVERNRRWSKMADALMREIKGKSDLSSRTFKTR